MLITKDHPLTRDIVKVFDVSPEFVQAYMSRQSFENLASFRDWASFSGSLTSSQLLYVDFAMSCVLRARSIVELMCGYTKPAERFGRRLRYLDVGCGYGGFVREFARRGFDSVGVELQQHLAEFSKANCASVANAKVVHGNFLECELTELGLFDVITCNDVIEHVDDPGQAMRRMGNLLVSDGVLFMEIPNRDCIESVISDGHYQLFGLTHLERSAAARFARQMNGVSDYLEQMGELYPLEYYVSFLKEMGLSVDVVQRHVVGTVDNVAALLARLSYAFQQWEEQHSHACDAHMKKLIRSRHSEYQSELWRQLNQCNEGTGSREFSLKYLNSFWSVVATKSS